MSLLPPNSMPLERHLEASTARAGDIDTSGVSELWNPDTCPAELLPWLAWAEGVDEWSSLWSESLKRSVIKAQRAIRRNRGTKQSVLDAVNALSGSASIREWWEYSPQGSPHTFDIVIAGGDGYVEAELQQSMIRAIERSKPVRSHYTLGVGLNAAAQLNFCALARVGTYKRMEFND